MIFTSFCLVVLVVNVGLAFQSVIFRKDRNLEGQTCAVADQVVNMTVHSDIHCSAICQMKGVCGSTFYDQAKRICIGCKKDKTCNPDFWFDAGIETIGYLKIDQPTTYPKTAELPPNTCKKIFDKQPDRNTTFMSSISCTDILNEKSDSKTGVYTNKLGMEILCDMDTDGGGWTVFQSRVDFSVNFNQNWEKYKYGFGDIFCGEFWLGFENILKVLHSNDKQFELRVEMLMDFFGFQVKTYQNFDIGEEWDKYRLKVSLNENDGSMIFHANGNMFSTYDSDNGQQIVKEAHCIESAGGGWWYHDFCYDLQVNGFGECLKSTYTMAKTRLMTRET